MMLTMDGQIIQLVYSDNEEQLEMSLSAYYDVEEVQKVYGV